MLNLNLSFNLLICTHMAVLCEIIVPVTIKTYFLNHDVFYFFIEYLY